MNGMTEFVNR